MPDQPENTDPVRAETPKPPAENTRASRANVGRNEYVETTRDGPMVFRKEFIRSNIEPPCDSIRKLLTEIEFEGNINDESTASAIAERLVQIEHHLNVLRAAALQHVQRPDGGEPVEAVDNR